MDKASLKALAVKVLALLGKLLALVWPPTKVKLHRLISLAGSAVAAWGAFEALTADLQVNGAPITLGGRLGSVAALVTIYATSAKLLLPKLDKAVDALPIPDDDKPEGKTP